MHGARTPRRGSRWGSHNGVFSVYIMSHLLLRSFPKEQLVSCRILDAYDPNGPGSSLTFLRALSISTKNYQNKRMKLARIERTTFWNSQSGIRRSTAELQLLEIPQGDKQLILYKRARCPLEEY